MNETLRFWLSAGCMGFGILCILFAIFGVYKFRFVMNRMHCAAIIDTLGIAGIVVGLMLAGATKDYLPKLLVVILILWVGSPIASHLVGRLEISTEAHLEQHMEMEGDTSNDSD